MSSHSRFVNNMLARKLLEERWPQKPVLGVPKNPADRNKDLRRLADGEDCTVRLPGGACDPATVVWAHTNTLADQKGRGYKGHDSAGFFACHRCHTAIDQVGVPPTVVELAQARTDVRLIAIALSPTMKPWKIAAAKWALERRGINCE